MINNFDEKMWLGLPIRFYDICTIYPLTLEDYLLLGDLPEDGSLGLNYNALFTQFMINDDFLKDAGVDDYGSVWDFFFIAKEQLSLLMTSISMLTHDANLQLDVANKRIVFSNGKYLSESTYLEFAETILQAHCFGFYRHVEQTMPHFKNKAHYDRWKRYQEMRAKQKKQEDSLNIVQCVKYIQLHSASYIADSEILHWTYWKVLHWYNAIVLQTNYNELHQCFAHWGGKDIRRSLDSLKQEIITKI